MFRRPALMRNATSESPRSMGDSSSSSSVSDSSSSSSSSDRPLMILRRPFQDPPPTPQEQRRVEYAKLIANLAHALPIQLEEAFLLAVDDLDHKAAENLQLQTLIDEYKEKLDSYKDLVHQQLRRESLECSVRSHAMLHEYEGNNVRAHFAIVDPAQTFSLIGRVETDEESGQLQFVADRRLNANRNCTLHVYQGLSWQILPPTAMIDGIPLKNNIAIVKVTKVFAVPYAPPLPVLTPSRRERDNTPPRQQHPTPSTAAAASRILQSPDPVLEHDKEIDHEECSFVDQE